MSLLKRIENKCKIEVNTKSRLEHSSNYLILERIQTSSEILRGVLIVQCATVQSDVSLGSMISMNMIGGLFGNESDLNTTVSN